MKDIQNILNSCVSILKTIRIDYNSPIGPRTRSLISEIKKLIPLLEKEQPHIANILRVSLGNLISNVTAELSKGRSVMLDMQSNCKYILGKICEESDASKAVKFEGIEKGVFHHSEYMI